MKKTLAMTVQMRQVRFLHGVPEIMKLKFSVSYGVSSQCENFHLSVYIFRYTEYFKDSHIVAAVSCMAPFVSITSLRRVWEREEVAFIFIAPRA